MTEILEAEIVEKDDQRMNEVAENIEKTVLEIKDGQAKFVTGFARLGALLLEVRQKKYWQHWGSDSFGDFIDSIKADIQKGRSQIYSSISVAERLLPYSTENDIEKMGITKATELAKIIKNTGKAPTEKILEHAIDPEVQYDEFKAELHEEYHVQKPDEKGKYRDLGGFFATDEEWQEIQDVFKLAEQQDPAIPKETPDWARRKEVIWRLVAEFRSTYGS